MDPEQTFIRVQERFSEMLTPKIRVFLEYLFLFLAITLFCILVVMHANYVQQPGCSSEFSSVYMSDTQLVLIKITSAGLWSHNESLCRVPDVLETKAGQGIHGDSAKDVNGVGHGSPANPSGASLTLIDSDEMKGKIVLRENVESQRKVSVGAESLKLPPDDVTVKVSKDVSHIRLLTSLKESLKAALLRIGKNWHGRLSFCWRLISRILGGLWVRNAK